MKRMAFATLVAIACAVPAYADVTIKATSSGAMGNAAPTTIAIKGAKMRQDVSMGGATFTTIIDAAAKQMIVLDAGTREAVVYDLAKLTADMQKVAGASDAKVSMTPTGETRQILGARCTGYVVNVTMPITMQGRAATVTIGGPVWIAKDAPGTADWVNFYKLAGDNGLFFASPRGGAQEARTQALMYKALAEAGGIPYEQEIRVTIEPAPQQPPPVTVMVTHVTTDPIPDERFAIPAGYTKVQK